ncbi:MAG: CxxC-x17-CxxC domain-containing protein [Patescibacteria group bacterium]
MKPSYNSDRRGGPKGGKRFGSGPSKFGGSAPWKRGADRDGDRPPLHDAVCGDCGAECQVPFRPTGSRPVLCRNCFKKDGGDVAPKRYGEKRSFDRPSFDRPSTGRSEGGNMEARLAAIERKLDAILEALSDNKLF